MSVFTRRIPQMPETNLNASVYAPAGTLPNGGFVVSTGGSENIQTILLPDLLEQLGLMTQDTALTIPAVAAARNLIAGTLARLTLKAYKDGEETPLPNQPLWLTRTNGSLSPQHRLLFTADDLIFTGWSLWLVERGADGYPVNAQRCPREMWTFDNKGRAVFAENNQPVDDGILIPGPIPGGILKTGRRTIAQMINMENQRSQRLRTPSPVTELKLNGEADLTPEETVAVRDNWVDARRSPNGAVAVTPHGMDVIDHTGAGVDLFTEASNALSLGIANHFGIPAAVIDAVVNGGASSFNYSSSKMDREWFNDSGLAFWAFAIESKLSMDEFTPRGTVVRFDVSATPGVTTPTETKEVEPSNVPESQ